MDAGEFVYLMAGAANRDPNAFDNPDKLDLRRNPNPHVAFGGGAHFCIGAPLARLEASIALRRLLERWSVIELAESHVRWRPTVNIRGLERLLVTVG
ncbi:cytochrome P450 [Antrihabitans sp. NCIMB 15449]|uniref:Cytochrome P450 n=1 Tax=Antrihabitans spumae TaxID=3373370 RepID=A0ABW7JH85_9NOCA